VAQSLQKMGASPMRNKNPWKLPPGPERRARLRRLDVAVTAEDYTVEEQALASAGFDDDPPAAAVRRGKGRVHQASPQWDR
jgi:hypothetical protein